MNSLDELINICLAYKRGEFDVIEFQKRLETVYLPSQYKQTIEVDQYNAHNSLEEIRFSYLEKNQKKYADQVADELICAIQSKR